MSKKYLKNIIGNTYTWLTVEEFIPSNDYESWWKCRCKCGKVIIAHREELVDNQIKSCGCYRIDQLSKKLTTHGFSSKNSTQNQKRFKSIWSNMKQRCLNPKNTNYPDYGGRGISLDSQWLMFKNFKKDLWNSYVEHVSQYGEENTTLGRKDVNGNYELSNVVWETNKEQAQSQRCSITSKNKKLHKFWKIKLQHEISYMLFQSKKLDKYHPNIKCTPRELREHFLSQFTEGMTWDNHGVYEKNNTNVWHIDHIVPCYKFDLANKSDRLDCFNYKNLRPWWAIDNFSKIR